MIEGLSRNAARNVFFGGSLFFLIVFVGLTAHSHYYVEGRYALEDTRMAVREARRQGLSVFAITVDSEARQYLPAIFGRAGYAVVRQSLGLTTALPLIYRQLIAQ